VEHPIVTGDTASVFAESVDIEGSLEGDGDVLLRGQVRGSISITGTLIVGETGRVHADVSAREVVNAGTVEGNIHAREKVRVQSTGLVHGDIDSPSIVIDDGGGVEGFVQMEPPGGEEEDDEDDRHPRSAAPSAMPSAAPPAAGRLGGKPLSPRPWQIAPGSGPHAAPAPSAAHPGLPSAPASAPAAAPASAPAAQGTLGQAPPAAGLLRTMPATPGPTAVPPANPLGDPLDVFGDEEPAVDAGDLADATDDVLAAGPLGSGNGPGGAARPAPPAVPRPGGSEGEGAAIRPTP
jgi:cytoskeletal protein CcmA (bactofilin family)